MTDTDGISLRVRNGFIQVDVRRNIGDFYFTHTFNAAPATALPLNQWSHVAVTWDGNALKAYVNGVEIGSISLVGGAVRTGSNSLTYPMIGNEPLGCNVQGGGFHFRGLIDELEVFDRVESGRFRRSSTLLVWASANRNLIWECSASEPPRPGAGSGSFRFGSGDTSAKDQ